MATFGVTNTRARTPGSISVVVTEDPPAFRSRSGTLAAAERGNRCWGHDARDTSRARPPPARSGSSRRWAVPGPRRRTRLPDPRGPCRSRPGRLQAWTERPTHPRRCLPQQLGNGGGNCARLGARGAGHANVSKAAPKQTTTLRIAIDFAIGFITGSFSLENAPARRTNRERLRRWRRTKARRSIDGARLRPSPEGGGRRSSRDNVIVAMSSSMITKTAKPSPRRGASASSSAFAPGSTGSSATGVTSRAFSARLFASTARSYSSNGSVSSVPTARANERMKPRT